MKIRSVLVANRGEIALRVFRTCRDLGLRTVAVVAPADVSAPHARAADVVVPVPGYLDGDAIVAAARAAGADAIHPGYGFLSENAGFARAVEDAGITWIGPSPAVIDLMGRKDRARTAAVEAGVPVVPSYPLDADPATLDYPVLVKAAAGGGGKGMRVVRSAAELPDALGAARREAVAAFGDDTLLVEKYVERGRHVEVQVLGDHHGAVVHLGDRDCSAQRRHQKVLEEAPAPARSADEAARAAQRCDDAVRLAAAVGYVGAGTVEFLLDVDSGQHYFLEMNTRLQVEHPVSELVMGTDLVRLQLQVAGRAGEPLRQEDLVPRGHAIEARVYAEDAWGGFLPQAGTASYVAWPAPRDGGGSGGPAGGVVVRTDHALESGQVVSTSYDPMLGKVIVHAPTREAARAALVRALDETVVLGVTTNTGFLRALVASDAFRDVGLPGGLDTSWLDRADIGGADLPAPDEAAARAVVLDRLAAEDRARTRGPFALDGWRSAAEPAPYVVPWLEAAPDAVSAVGGTRVAALRRTAHAVEAVVDGQQWRFAEPDPFTASAAAAGDGALVAPMPGTVTGVAVQVGDTVTEGTVVVTMEAMKMELALRAPFDGTVTSLAVAVGDPVALGALLAEVEASAS
ncbi:acetyl-CoA/propionyl-CoA carboxylase biotin carboxyl carrier protein [Nocardioides zeae]|uniref:Acetyl-CoA/propionyl-CoA carboxylase biotin carboxyl carrier protein n=1 Tax=Nocardioides zeae TaxID=1457234 RepID=A0ACC6IK85_9ACTN|nr:biotin carboxylase N-terminal domain-containing protein [Nocardioides zeae]MDR6173685.1 acetyl-CoA/propionyl-CoA carboxylase biotin carboxyl carrier protein [Nocardioides zeae]MDR6211088.1 acetyl-CoA/propionyl-CoA carboxylase biotin carboxyl carrier protein [Nocardioides zeae]